MPVPAQVGAEGLGFNAQPGGKGFGGQVFHGGIAFRVMPGHFPAVDAIERDDWLVLFPLSPISTQCPQYLLAVGSYAIFLGFFRRLQG